MTNAPYPESGLTPCYYCGLPADTVDHVVPQTLLARLELVPDLKEDLAHLLRVSVIAACRQCNSILSERIFRTLGERRAYVKQRLRIKYRSLLSAREWTDDEMAELGHTLESFVRNRKAFRQTILQRLRWPQR